MKLCVESVRYLESISLDCKVFARATVREYKHEQKYKCVRIGSVIGLPIDASSVNQKMQRYVCSSRSQEKRVLSCYCTAYDTEQTLSRLTLRKPTTCTCTCARLLRCPHSQTRIGYNAPTQTNNKEESGQ